MFNKYMFSYVLINVKLGSVEHTLGTQEAIDYYDAEERLRNKIKLDFPESDGWEIKSFLVNNEEVEYVSERV